VAKKSNLIKVEYVGNFIQDIHENLTPRMPGSRTTSFWISRAGEGGFVLDEAEGAAYSAVIDRLVKDFAPKGDLSRRSLEVYIQDALFYSLDLPRSRPDSFDERVKYALDELYKRLSSPSLSYRCFVPILGFSSTDLPFTFGDIRFVNFGASHLREFLKSMGSEAKFKEYKEELNWGGKLWGSSCASVKVSSRDFDSAEALARIKARAVVDSLNFFHDLIPYNYGWLYFPGEGANVMEQAALGSSEGKTSLHQRRVGPGQFSLENLRTHGKVIRRFLRALNDLIRSVQPKTAGEVLLTAARWAGRASIEPKREERFLLFAIALEAVVLPEIQSEVQYRLSLRVAGLLGKNRKQQEELRESVRKLYNIRSKIVHNGAYEVTDDELGRLRELTKIAILRILRQRSLWTVTREKFGQWLESKI
jgi:hypothetical protein